MDLAKLDTAQAAEHGSEMHLRHPGTGEFLFQDLPEGASEDTPKEPITMSLLGMDSKRYREVQRINAERRLKRPDRSIPLTQDELIEEAVFALTELTVGWKGVKIDGEVKPYSKANVRAVYQRFPWLREQADQFIVNRNNFLPKSATS